MPLETICFENVIVPNELVRMFIVRIGNLSSLRTLIVRDFHHYAVWPAGCMFLSTLDRFVQIRA